MSQTEHRRVRARAITESVTNLRPQIVAALQELVRIPSQTGDELGAQLSIATMMRDHGLDVEMWEPDHRLLEPHAESVTIGNGFADRPNVLGLLHSDGAGRSLILNGHIDTVEPGDERAWEHPPLSGAVKEGRLYGRGSCDMKGGLVANLFALHALRQAGFIPAGDVIMQSTISEEDGGAGALAAILRGYVADGVVISEPTGLALVPAHGGALMFRLHVPGLSAHAGARDEGESAIEKFAYLHHGLLQFEARRNREITDPLYAELPNKVPINVGTIHGGAWASSVPEFVVAEGRAGLIPGENLATFKQEFAGEISRLAVADPWLRNNLPRVEWLNGQFAPAAIPIDSPLVSTLSEVWTRAYGTQPKIIAEPYGADMRHFVMTGGMPCLMFGAGDVRLAHAPNESIPLEELFTAVRITAEFIAEWCGVM